MMVDRVAVFLTPNIFNQWVLTASTGVDE